MMYAAGGRCTSWLVDELDGVLDRDDVLRAGAVGLPRLLLQERFEVLTDDGVQHGVGSGARAVLADFAWSWTMAVTPTHNTGS